MKEIYRNNSPVKEDFEKRYYAIVESFDEAIIKLQRKEELINKLKVENEILIEEIMRLRARYEQ